MTARSMSRRPSWYSILAEFARCWPASYLRKLPLAAMYARFTRARPLGRWAAGPLRAGRLVVVTRCFTRCHGTVCLPNVHHGGRTDMPMVTVKLIEGVFTPAQKQEMIRKITDTMVEIEGENLRPVTWVLVEEVRSGDWGIGGNGLTTADVHALQGQQAAAVAG